MKILIFSSFSQNFKKKNGINLLDHYIMHIHTKFQADIIFGSHFTTLRRCCPSDGSMVRTHWGLAFGITTSSMSFYALPFLCGLVEKRLVYKTAISDFQNFSFSKPKFWILLLFTFWILFGFSKPRLTYALSPENCETQTWDQL